jgi:putative transposase
MPRIARGLRSGYVYHVLNRGNAKQEVFHKPQDYEAFVSLMYQGKQRNPIQVLAFCLMPNHFHLVLKPSDSEGLSKYMQWLMTSHVRRYHKHYSTSGHIWQGRFKSFPIQLDNHLLTVMRYVERNPVASNLVRSILDWPWSSCLERSGASSTYLLDPPPIELPMNWRDYVNAPLTEKELHGIGASIQRRCPYGKPDWRLQTSKLLGLESTLREIGRPKKSEK